MNAANVTNQKSFAGFGVANFPSQVVRIQRTSMLRSKAQRSGCTHMMRAKITRPMPPCSRLMIQPVLPLPAISSQSARSCHSTGCNTTHWRSTKICTGMNIFATYFLLQVMTQPSFGDEVLPTIYVVLTIYLLSCTPANTTSPFHFFGNRFRSLG